jgi:hypothetical protein
MQRSRSRSSSNRGKWFVAGSQNVSGMDELPMVEAIEAPSSPAVQVAKEFTRLPSSGICENHFNVFQGTERIAGPTSASIGVWR